MAIDVQPDPTSKTYRKKSPSSLLRSRQRRTRWSEKIAARKHNVKTEAEKRHERLFRARVADMNRDTFAAFILSAYC